VSHAEARRGGEAETAEGARDITQEEAERLYEEIMAE
jgi:hypothetical protein